MRRHHSAQNLTDYVLILGLIAIVSLGGLFVCSKSLKGFFDNLQGDINSSAANTTPASAPLTTAGALAVTVGSPSTLPVTTAPPSSLPPELAALLAQMPQMTNSYIETSGVGGATQVSLDYLKTLAAQLQASNVISPQQSAALINLANSGHQIAHAQGYAEWISGVCGSDNQCFNKYMAENGWPPDPATMAFIAEGKLNASNLLDSSLHWSFTVTPFQNAYADALGAGAMDNPEVKKAVTQLSEQIVKLFLATHVIVNNIGTNAITPAELTNNVASTATHTNSAGICITGTGVDAGTKCI